ncbi:MAG: hypothetical protein LH606_00635 [Cytophagaceae bacterium]|nr:hypothetical protein [Cytophagaceae bacterium]
MKISRFLLVSFLLIQSACSDKTSTSNTGLTGTVWQFDHATGLTTVALTPATSIETTTQYIETADQAPFKNQKLIFYDASNFGGLVPLSLHGPVAATGTYTQKGDQLQFTFNFRGYHATPGSTQGLTPDSGKTAAYLRIVRQSDDELVLLQDVESLGAMEDINQKDPDKRALYAKSTATYYFKRVE